MNTKLNGYLNSEAYQEACDLHGKEFINNLTDVCDDQEDCEEEYEDVPYKPSFRTKMTRLLNNKFVWYAAGAADALIVVAVVWAVL